MMVHLTRAEAIELADNLDWGNPLENPEDIKDSIKFNWTEIPDEESVEAVYEEMVKNWMWSAVDDFLTDGEYKDLDTFGDPHFDSDLGEWCINAEDENGICYVLHTTDGNIMIDYTGNM